MNPFATGNKKPREIQERINQANADYNSIIEKAKVCLADPIFQDFKKDYEKVYVQLFQILLDLPMNDPIQFSIQIESLRNKIILLQSFGFNIETAAHAPKRPIVPVTSEGVQNAKSNA